MRKPVSIIIATYNCGRKLVETLESVLAQPAELYEIVVIDGGSTDETLSVLEEYKSRITLISERDRGVYDAFNKGIAVSTGKYLFFLGAGDRLRPGMLTEIVRHISFAGPAFIYGNTHYMRQGLVVRGEFSKEDFMIKNLCHQSIFYAREIFEMLGEYSLKYKIYADWAFNMKCYADRRIQKIYVDTVIVDFEEGGISETQSDSPFHDDLPKLLMRYVGLKPSLKLRLYNRRVAFYRFRRKLAESFKALVIAP